MAYHFNFGLVWHYGWRLTDGLLLALGLAIVALLFGMLIGLPLAVRFVDGGRVSRAGIACYVELIRNTPLILLVYMVFYGLPSALGFYFDPILSFLVTLSVYAGAYFVEVFRAALTAVPRGVLDAGAAAGLTPWQRLIAIRLPIMLRAALPAMGNTCLSLFKDTSIGSVIAVPELAFGAQWITVQTFRSFEVYAVVAPMYLATGLVLLSLLRLLERRLTRRGYARP